MQANSIAIRFYSIEQKNYYLFIFRKVDFSMKKFIATSAALAFSVLTFAACGASVNSSSAAAASEESKIEETASVNTLYRGTVTSYTDKQLIVEQLPGYDYGQSSIIFNLDDKTKIFDDGIAIGEGTFVEVTYSGALTRSMPPQASAETVTVISAFSQGIIVNGEIKDVVDNGDSYTITVYPIADSEKEVTESASTVEVEESMEFDNNATILIVPADALEGGLTGASLTEGTLVSAVSKGIATSSLPPQVPVLALMPYSVLS